MIVDAKPKSLPSAAPSRLTLKIPVLTSRLYTYRALKCHSEAWQKSNTTPRPIKTPQYHDRYAGIVLDLPLEQSREAKWICERIYPSRRQMAKQVDRLAAATQA